MSPPPDVLGQALWAIGSAFCHQIPERSLSLGGYQLPVCARDLGTYLGFFIMSSFFFITRRYRRVELPDRPMLALAIVGVALFLFDALSSYLGFRGTDNALRLGSGLAFGAAVSMLLLNVASVQLFHGKERTATFTWRDGLLLYPMLALIGVALLTVDDAALYYPVAVIAEIGLMVVLFLTAATLLSLLVPRLGLAKGRMTLILLSMGLVIAIIAILLLLRTFTSFPFAD